MANMCFYARHKLICRHIHRISRHMLMSFKACSMYLMCRLWRGFRSTHRIKFSFMSRHMTYTGRHMLQMCRHMLRMCRHMTYIGRHMLWMCRHLTYIDWHIRCIFPKKIMIFQIFCILFSSNLHIYKYFIHASFQIVENLKDTKENIVIFNLSLHVHNNYT